MKRGFLPVAVVLAMLLPARGEEDHPVMFPDAAVYEKAMAAVPAIPEAGSHAVTGIVVPHHLVAADLMALGFRAAAAREVRRIILLTPEHFKRSPTPVATTRRGFASVWGRVPTDEAAVDALLGSRAAVSESVLFDKEHGVHALLPFIARFFPQAAIVPVAVRIDSKPEDWDPLIDALLPLVDETTLIVQSTDFSHYLEVNEARRRDRETLAVLATGDSEGVIKLRQPDHLDSRAAQVIHMTLQRRLGNSGHAIIGNRNSQDYSMIHQSRTTSYVVQVFEKKQGAGWPVGNGEELWYFGGDAFFGRHVAASLSKPERFDKVRERILRLTRGAPLVVNLEGVMIPRVPDPKAQRPLAMREDFALKCLKALNVRAAGVANNHSLDLGPETRDRTAALLEENGIKPLRDGEWVDLGKFRIAGLTDLCNESAPRSGRLGQDGIARLMEAAGADKPAIAFVHWGAEWQRGMTPRQQRVLEWLSGSVGGGVIPGEQGNLVVRPQASGLALVLGAHPHVAAGGLMTHGPGKVLVAPSLGNLVFDQPDGDGALVEVRFFPCGTHATRWIPIGNVLSDRPGKDHSPSSSTTTPAFQENPAGTR